MFGKMAIRNIPEEVLTALEALAARNDRSVEAEARIALRSHVQPTVEREIRNTRVAEVGTRLTNVLEQVNQVRGTRTLKPSHIAQAIGEDRASEVEDWFIGQEEPTFTQLASIADYLGCSRDWLQHGDGKMFKVHTERLSESAGEAVEQLLDLNAERPVTFLHLVREESAAGELLIIKQYDDWRCATWTTPIHVSDAIGAGGERALSCLSVTLQLLYAYYTSRRGTRVLVKSYQLPSEACKAIRGGATHPLVPLQDGYERPWWEDFWDEGQFREHADYWVGWKAICERIFRVVSNDDRLNQLREQIARKQHPLFPHEFGIA
ncbi:hypothetical protein LMG28614_06204 [Paraburkholderia ultramafica]|uniref:HTH cro/C1-type domain-containing protein n=1 Tax=Paraburkholderia ultramafica TaxID=1544867 RepID=A0A6S7BLZ7_9BURK|nr:hypothetical protein [Paraburkholderia ultramafica]CAB3805421.1 hypothetical protein LMG28614_06204 [Paraburkholderia ultramafica]